MLEWSLNIFPQEACALGLCLERYRLLLFHRDMADITHEINTAARLRTMKSFVE